MIALARTGCAAGRLPETRRTSEMTDMEKTLQNIKRMGTAKIAGLTCNKHAEEIILRIDLQVPVAQAESALEALGLEPTKQLLDSLETALQGLKKRVGKGYSGQA